MPRKRKRSKAPPASLIKLLQNDPDVYSYFESLQADLKSDVQVWKNRTAAWEKKYHQDVGQDSKEKSTRANKTKNNSKVKAIEVKEHAKDEDDTPQEIEVPVTLPQNNTQEEINDDAFDFSSDSDSDVSNIKPSALNNKQVNKHLQNFDLSSDSSTGDNADSKTPNIRKNAGKDSNGLNTQSDSLSMLEFAFNTLKKHNVNLIESKGETSDKINSDSSDVGSELDDRAENSIMLRSDDDIVAEVLHAIHKSCQVDTTSEIESVLFIGDELVPVCNVDVIEHSSRQVMIDLFRSLAILDTKHSLPSTISDIELSSNNNDFDCYICLRRTNDAENGNSSLAELFLQTMKQDICCNWATNDRRKYRNKPSSSIVYAGSDMLSTLASETLERCICAQITIALYLYRNDYDTATNILCEYLFSTCASLESSDFSAVNLLVIESLLFPTLLWWADESSIWWNYLVVNLEIEHCTIFIAILHCAASSWETHRDSGGPNNVFRAHHACYERLVCKLHAISSQFMAVHQSKSTLEQLRSINVNIGSHFTQNCDKNSAIWCFKKTLVSIYFILTNADCHTVYSTFDDLFGGINHTSDDDDDDYIFFYLDGLCTSLRKLYIDDAESTVLPMSIQDAKVATYIERIQADLRNVDKETIQVNLTNACVLTKYFMAASDGEGVCVLIDATVDQLATTNAVSSERDAIYKHIRNIISHLSEQPTVRIINLERRKDRLRSIHGQCVANDMLMVRAVPDSFDDTDISTFGNFAFDGQGTLLQATDMLTRQVGSKAKLDHLVSPTWHPNTLRPFDSNAPKEETTVYLSPSERSCALSHLYSWKGVARTLKQPDLQSTAPSSNLRNANMMKRLARLSGFASGRPLDPKKSQAPPTPVCIILEDDAILQDDFTLHLSNVLSELPRDFHFCSIGYGRPKTAPILKYGEYIGIPTGIWYLTGYILSQAGVEYLLANLPIVGPVDSWISIKILANWDNVYGTSIGVGTHPKVLVDPLPDKVLRSVLKFQAYCALTPLCHQKVGDKGWRNRDTDVTYSGFAHY